MTLDVAYMLRISASGFIDELLYHTYDKSTIGFFNGLMPRLCSALGLQTTTGHKRVMMGTVKPHLKSPGGAWRYR